MLHHRPFRDSSQIVDIISKDHGRLSVVARGSRSAKSRYRGVLRPFLALRMSWVIRSDMGTLTGAEIEGAPQVLGGKALMSGYYANELLLRLLHRHDPQPEIFKLYDGTVQALAGGGSVSAALRRFEFGLLRLLGYGLNLGNDSLTGRAIEADRHYQYRVEQGLIEDAENSGSITFKGHLLQKIAAEEFSEPDVLKAAGLLFREVLAYHLDGRELKSRKVLIDLQRNLKSP